MTRWTSVAAVATISTMGASVSGADAETLLERGTYLATSIVACGNCHTPKGPEGELPGMELAGMAPLFEAPTFTANSANITPDTETGIGGWTEAEIVTAIREGRRPDGSLIGPPMPIGLYRNLSDTDANAIAAYIRQVPAVRNEIPASDYRMELPPNYGPPVTSVADVSREDKVAYGAYLAGPAGHCIECHSPMGANGAPDIEHKLGAGGLEFPGPWGVSVSANITPTGLAKYTDDDLKRIIREGVRPNGSKLLPPMPVPYYAKMTDADVEAIVAYLRTLPPM